MNAKEIRRKKKALEAELELNKEAIAEKQRKGNKLLQEIRELEHNLEMIERRKGKVVVTDHAIVRYMERVSGIDIDAIRSEIREIVPSHERLKGINNLNVFKGSHKIVIKDSAVVTVSPK